MTESELLTHAALQASVWTDVMMALRRLVPAEPVVQPVSEPMPTFAFDRSKLADAPSVLRSKPQAPSAAAKKAKPAAPKKPTAPAVDRKKRDLLDWAAREQTVIVVLRSAHGPLKTAEVATKARLTDYATKETLRRLVKAGRVLHTESTVSSRYSPCPVPSSNVRRQPPPTPAPAHGTATSPATIIKADGQEFERVWDGASKAGLTSVGRS